jgi:twitching motility protein PilT
MTAATSPHDFKLMVVAEGPISEPTAPQGVPTLGQATVAPSPVGPPPPSAPPPGVHR